MPRPRMHDDQVDVDVATAQRLLRAQAPTLADLPITPVPSDGTDHTIYRLGDGFTARFPLIGWADYQAALEAEWLPRLARALPVALHEPVHLGEPGEGYPWQWSVYRWLPGSQAHPSRIADQTAFAAQVADLVLALRAADATGAPRSPRGFPLRLVDEQTRLAIESLRDELDDADALLAVWEEAVSAPTWGGEFVLAHGDLTSGNLLVDDHGNLTALIDFSMFGTADPANDLESAWDVLDDRGRAVLRERVGIDGATWARARGWAVRCVGAIEYYRDTNPGIVERARRRLRNVTQDYRAGRP